MRLGRSERAVRADCVRIEPRGVRSGIGTRPKLREGQSQFGFAPVVQTSACSAMARASSTSIPRYLTVLSTFPTAAARHVSCRSTVDERRFGASQRVRGEKVPVEANRCKPVRDELGILQGGHTAL